jgi:Spy/CpxP family protein refolding chaperone
MRLLAHNRSQSVVNTVRKSMMALAIGLMVGSMAAAPSAIPSGMLYQGDVFQLVVKLRTVAQFASLTSAQRAQITIAVQHHRNAIRTAPTEELQLAAATGLISDVAGILTPAQRAELARTMSSGSATPHATRNP